MILANEIIILNIFRVLQLDKENISMKFKEAIQISSVIEKYEKQEMRWKRNSIVLRKNEGNQRSVPNIVTE